VPFEIREGASEVIDCDLVPLGPGDFSAQINVYVGDEELREIILTVQGTAQAGERSVKTGGASGGP
jgi:hypothetical protein